MIFMRPNWDLDYWRRKRTPFVRLYDRFVDAMLKSSYSFTVDIIRKEVPNGKCLEIGCGEANISKQLYATGNYDITIADISQQALYIAKRNFYENLMEEPKISEQDINNIRFKNGSFDVSTNFGVLEHLDDVSGAIREMKRVGSVVIATVPEKSPIWSIAGYIRAGIENDANIWTKQTKYYTKEQMRQFFNDAGIKDVMIYSTTMPPMMTVVGK